MTAFVALASAGTASGGGGLVALNSCDLSCPDDTSHFYVACGNGTVTDNRTGLVWLADADCFGQLTWDEAMAVVAGLGDIPAHACAGMEPDECDCGLSDHSSPGEWRLPTMAEWEDVISAGWDADSCAPAISNDVGNGCWTQACADAGMCSFHDPQAASYWSGSSYVADPVYAWVGDLGAAGVTMLARSSTAHLWPVRGGQ
jgi:hypothetical protein